MSLAFQPHVLPALGHILSCSCICSRCVVTEGGNRIRRFISDHVMEPRRACACGTPFRARAKEKKSVSQKNKSRLRPVTSGDTFFFKRKHAYLIRNCCIQTSIFTTTKIRQSIVLTKVAKIGKQDSLYYMFFFYF